jgi:hypothetical protein
MPRLVRLFALRDADALQIAQGNLTDLPYNATLLQLNAMSLTIDCVRMILRRTDAILRP